MLGKVKVANLWQVFKKPLIWPLVSACSSAWKYAKVYLPVCMQSVLSSCLQELRSKILGELCKDHFVLLFLTQALTRCLFQSLLNMMGIFQLSSVNFGLCFDCIFVLIQHHIRTWTILSLFSIAYDHMLTTLEFSSTIEILWTEFVEAGRPYPIYKPVYIFQV